MVMIPKHKVYMKQINVYKGAVQMLWSVNCFAAMISLENQSTKLGITEPFFLSLFFPNYHIKQFPPKHTVPEVDLLQDQKIYCLQACVNTFQPWQFTGYSSEGVNILWSSVNIPSPTSSHLMTWGRCLMETRRLQSFRVRNKSLLSSVSIKRTSSGSISICRL